MSFKLSEGAVRIIPSIYIGNKTRIVSIVFPGQKTPDLVILFWLSQGIVILFWLSQDNFNIKRWYFKYVYTNILLQVLLYV